MRSTPNRNQFQHKDNPLEEDMNDETLKFIKIIISKGSSVPDGSARSPYQVACGERDIHKGMLNSCGIELFSLAPSRLETFFLKSARSHFALMMQISNRNRQITLAVLIP